jgi:hypothetical protein
LSNQNRKSIPRNIINDINISNKKTNILTTNKNEMESFVEVGRNDFTNSKNNPLKSTRHNKKDLLYINSLDFNLTPNNINLVSPPNCKTTKYSPIELNYTNTKSSYYNIPNIKETFKNKFLPSISKIKSDKNSIKNGSIDIKVPKKKSVSGFNYLITDLSNTSEIPNKNNFKEIINLNTMKVNYEIMDDKKYSNMFKNSLITGPKEVKLSSISNQQLAFTKNKILNSTYYSKIKEKVKDLYSKDYFAKIHVN